MEGFFGEFQGGKNDIIDVFTKKVWGVGAKLLCSEVYANLLKDILIIEQSPLASLLACFWWWKMTMTKQEPFILMNIPGKVFIFTHVPSYVLQDLHLYMALLSGCLPNNMYEA